MIGILGGGAVTFLGVYYILASAIFMTLNIEASPMPDRHLRKDAELLDDEEESGQGREQEQRVEVVPAPDPVSYSAI